MKLNPECIRDFLLTIEEICDMGHYFDSGEDKTDRLQCYDDEEIAYHARQCNLSGFLYEYSSNLGGGFSVIDLTPQGHEFLANIREDSNWEKVKTISSQVGSKSLRAISQIASSIITEVIKTQLGLP